MTRQLGNPRAAVSTSSSSKSTDWSFFLLLSSARPDRDWRNWNWRTCRSSDRIWSCDWSSTCPICAASIWKWRPPPTRWISNRDTNRNRGKRASLNAFKSINKRKTIQLLGRGMPFRAAHTMAIDWWSSGDGADRFSYWSMAFVTVTSRYRFRWLARPLLGLLPNCGRFREGRDRDRDREREPLSFNRSIDWTIGRRQCPSAGPFSVAVRWAPRGRPTANFTVS